MNGKAKVLQVSAAQMHWARSLERNMEETEKYIKLAAREGSRVLLLPEAKV